MKLLFFGLSLFFLLLTPSILAYSFAQNSYDVNIPTGAANPDAPYFWQSEKDGSTTGIIEIFVGDTVVWKNADTTRHTITSGSGPSNADGLFDSGYFGPGLDYFLSPNVALEGLLAYSYLKRSGAPAFERALIRVGVQVFLRR